MSPPLSSLSLKPSFAPCLLPAHWGHYGCVLTCEERDSSLGTIRALQQEGGGEPWTVCVHLPLGKLWQGSCLPWPNKNNWKPLCSSAQMQEWRGGIMDFLQGQLTWANPWHYSCVLLPWDKHMLLVRKREISDCQDHTWPITVQSEWNLNKNTYLI